MRTLFRWFLRQLLGVCGFAFEAPLRNVFVNTCYGIETRVTLVPAMRNQAKLYMAAHSTVLRFVSTADLHCMLQAHCTAT
jgi:hypothetical protein